MTENGHRVHAGRVNDLPSGDDLGPLAAPLSRPAPDPEAVSFVCPRCRSESFHPQDVKEGYCANCHDWTGKEQQQE